MMITSWDVMSLVLVCIVAVCWIAAHFLSDNAPVTFKLFGLTVGFWAIATAFQGYVGFRRFPEIELLLQHSALSSLALGVAMVSVVSHVPLKYTREIILLVASLELGLLIGGTPMMLSPTFSSAFIVACFQAFFKADIGEYPARKEAFIKVLGYLLVLALCAIFGGGASMWFIFVVCWSIDVWMTLNNRPRTKLALMIIALGSVTMMLGDSGGHERLMHWRKYLSWVEPYIHTGTGAGSFYWLGPMIDGLPTQSETLRYMHNDYIQVLFEFGLPGFFLVMTLVVFTLWQIITRYTSNEYSSVILGFLALACVYHPMHVPVSAFLILITYCSFVRKAL